jgi:hypothetical protein
MAKKERNFIIKFDGKEASDEERKNAFLDLCRIFMKLAAEDYISKYETKKERKRVEQNLHDFSSKLLRGIDKSYDKTYKK